MTIKRIIRIGNSLLRRKSVEITEFNAPGLKQLQEDLHDTLAAFREQYGYGRGISAVQIGTLRRAIYIKMQGFEDFLINPNIIFKSEKKFWTWDSCFSANIAFFIKIKRHFTVNVEYFTLNGHKKIITAEGDLSELLQHEIDHLDGVLFIDYLDAEKKFLLMKEEYEKIAGLS